MIHLYVRTLLAFVFLVVMLVLFCSDFVIASTSETNKLLVVTPYTSQADGRNRFMRSSRVYGYHVKVLGDADEGDVSDKKLLELLTEELSRHNSDNLVLYTHSEDVVLAGGPLRVVEEFERCGCEILVSADGFCWPDRTLESSYPKVERGKRFLNSGGLVGRVGALYRLLKEAPEEESLQLLLSHVYVKDATRNKYSVKLDHLSNLFQNLNGATGDIELRFAGKEAYLQNTLYNTVPVVVRGNGHTALVLHNLGSYLAKAWNPEEGCRPCWDNMIAFEKISEEEYPLVTIAIFIEKETPFMEEFTRKINNLKYPKAKLDLYLHNAEEYHEPGMTEWLETVTPDYRSVKYVGAEENVKEWHARNAAMDYCVERDCKFLFSVDSDGHLDNPHTLKLLIEQNRTVVAPMLIRPYKAWSNFWGAITNDGFYARSMDYMDLVQGQRRGLWNVPYITTCVLVQRSVFDDPETRPSFIKNLLDPDMAFCENLREKGIFMFVSNRVDFGHLVNTDNFDTSRKYSELWQIFDNRWDWEHRYIHPNYSLTVAENATVQMPCPDVYWFPLFKERFASEMIETFEAFGAWSDGSSNDPRLEGGYESVPTIDIHMKQVGMEAEWLELLRAYVQPIQQKVFEGYFNDVGVSDRSR